MIKSAPTPGMKVYNGRNPLHVKAFKTYVRSYLVPQIEDRVYRATMRCICDPDHPLYQWNIHHSDVDLKAQVRKYIYNNFNDIVQKFYYNPDTHATTAGYEGWYEFPVFGCLAFFNPDDGTPGNHPDSNPLFHW